MEVSAQLKHVDLSLIKVSGANPRKNLKGENFKELKQSIAEHGILEPLLVRPKGKGYELVAGERRLTAAKELKLETVPVAIRDVDDRTARVLMLLENLQRQDLEPLEEAAAIEELLKDTGDGGMTQKELAKKLSKSQPWVANRLRLLKAPDKVKQYLISGQMTPQHLIALLPYCDKEALMGQVLRKYDEKVKYKEGCSVQELQGYVSSILRYNDNGRYAFRPDRKDMGYLMGQLAKDMDLEVCKDCKKTVMVEDQDYDGKKSKVRVCLETDCFRPKVNEARKKIKDRDHVKLDKAVKSGAVSTDKLRYGVDYKDMDYVRFPREWCKGCPKMQKGTGSQRTVTGRSHERICLMPHCLSSREEYYNQRRPAVVKKIHSAVESAQKIYLKERPPGFKKHELQFIYLALCEDSERQAKKVGGMNDKQLEQLLLEAAVANETRSSCFFNRELYYGDLDADAVLQKLPFKVVGDFSIPPPEPPEIEQPEAPKTKKVQEKRKKKGA